MNEAPTILSAAGQLFARLEALTARYRALGGPVGTFDTADAMAALTEVEAEIATAQAEWDAAEAKQRAEAAAASAASEAAYRSQLPPEPVGVVRWDDCSPGQRRLLLALFAADAAAKRLDKNRSPVLK